VRSSGELSSLADIRTVVRQSSKVTTFEPSPGTAWETAAKRFGVLQQS
jgi:hypothetical protein